jgi:hypothetical protein
MGASVCGCTCRMCVCISFLKLEYQLGDAIELALRYCVRCACNTWMATIRLICRAHTAAAAQQVYRLLFGTHTARAHHRACRESHGHIQSAARLRSNIYGRPAAANHAPRAHAYILYAKIKFYAYNARAASCCLFSMQISRNKRQMRNPSTSITRLISL